MSAVQAGKDDLAAVTRRSVLSGLAGMAGAAVAVRVASAKPADDGLAAQARRRGLRFGCAVRPDQLEAYPELRAAISRECDLLVPENEMKWRALEPEKGDLRFEGAERVAAFASDHEMGLRGHTLVWHQNPPIWAIPELEGAGGAKLVLDHVETVATRFKGRILDWDVVNEALMPTGGELRDWPIYARGGYGFIADCFEAAHAADPDAKLYYNDFGLEYGAHNDEQKRRGALRLLAELKGRAAPIHGLGIQSHLVLGRRFRDTLFRRFLAEVAGMGLAIRLTEFDVNDGELRGSVAFRDAIVVGEAKAYLDTAFDEPAVNGLLTWGLTNRLTWLGESNHRSDGTLPRCLPLDENYERTPLWHAIAGCLEAAPTRG